MTSRFEVLSVVGLLLGPLAMTATSADAGQGDAVKFRVRVQKKRGGKVLCALYDNEDKWLSDDGVFRSTAVRVKGKWATCVFKRVPRKRVYAIAALHDEDGDGEMDTNLIGLPEEGYAASRNAHKKGIGAPDWEDAVFSYRAGVVVQRASMKY